MRAGFDAMPQWIDDNPLPLALACMLIALMAAWQPWSTRGRTRLLLRPLRPLRALALLGIAVAAAALLAGLALAERNGMAASIDHWVSVVPPSVRGQWVVWLTTLGDPGVLGAFALLLAGALVCRRQRVTAIIVLATIAANGLLVRALKHAVERERPVQLDALVSVTGWSFPSGHAAGAMMVYGCIAVLVRRYQQRDRARAVGLGMLAVVVAVGFSRLLLDVHFATDVIAGYALASISLVTMIALVQVAHRRLGDADSANPVRDARANH